jgi:hypothetical protein
MVVPNTSVGAGGGDAAVGDEVAVVAAAANRIEQQRIIYVSS